MANQGLGAIEAYGGAPVARVQSGAMTAATLSNGNIISVVPHYFEQRLLVWETPANKSAPTLRATINVPVSFNNYQVGLHSNNDVSILVRASDGRSFRYVKMTYATYAVGSWETAFTCSAPTTFEAFAMDVTDGNMIVVAVTGYNGSNASGSYVYARTPGGSWGSVYGAWITNGAIARGCHAAAIVSLGINSGIRDVVVAHGLGKSGTDYGVRVSTIRITESNATISGSITLRQTLMSGEGDTSASGKLGGRAIALYRESGVLNYALMISHSVVNRRIGLTKGGMGGTSWSSSVPLSTTQLPNTPISFLAFSSNQESYGFHYGRDSGTSPIVGTTVARVSGTVVQYSPDHHFVQPGLAVWAGLGGTVNRNLAGGQHPLTTQTFHFSVGLGLFSLAWASIPAPGGQAIKVLSPVNNGQLTSANPDLAASIDFDLIRGQSKYKVQFQFAKDTGFTTNLVDYIQPDAKFVPVVGTNTAGVLVTITDALPASFTIQGSPWYYRARLIDEYGNVGGWTSTNYLSIGHPPTLTPNSLNGGNVFFWNGGVVNFDWLFTDSSSTDYQTAYQVQVYTSTGTIVLDTGKVTSGSPRHAYTMAPAQKDVQLYWVVRGWDSEDTIGGYSTPAFFLLTDPPIALVTSPVSGSTLATGVPTITGTVTTGGGRQIREYTVFVTQNGRLVWSKRFPGPVASGATINEKVPQGFLNDGEQYTVQISLVDTGGMAGVSALTPFTVDWVPPAGPASLIVDVGTYNIDDMGYVDIVWDDAARETQYFTGWIVYRKDDQINPNTLVVTEEGDWKVIDAEYSTSFGYEHKDYYAPSGYKVSYRVTQTVNRDGQDIESTNLSPTVVYPMSDGYWLIEPNSDNADSDAFKLSIVTDESFSEEQEEAEFTVIGRGRIINKGQDLGVRGTLDVQLRDTGGTTARQKRLRLKKIQKVNGQLWLRNPFGDIFKVNVGAMSVSRIAGVGKNEFCDVSIPYTEVS